MSVERGNDPAGSAAPPLMPPLFRRLSMSGKLLLLTIPFVLLAAILIYVPSIANFRMNRLNDRVAAANTAALVLEAAPSGMVPDELARQVLQSIGARAVAIKMGQQRRLLAIDDVPPLIDHDVDMRTITPWSAIVEAIGAMFETDNDAIRVVGSSREGQFIEVVIDEKPLRLSMYRFSSNLLAISVAISIVTVALVYLAMHYLFVRPMRRITANLVAFHQDPENPTRIIVPSRRGDEIGRTEIELFAMQRDLVSMLNQKNRLAALGLAVSKINHDLRNLLASAQLISDQLSTVPDPRVQRFAPKLMRSLERAIAFCQSTLSYGKAQEATPDRRIIQVEPVVNEVRDSLGLGAGGRIAWIDVVERGLVIDADPDQLFRVVLNLVRNAAQALESHAERGRRDRPDPGDGPARRLGDHSRDFRHRPGCAGEGARASVRGVPGLGARRRHGLGLAIAAELVRAHGGELVLVEGTIGATFRLAVPDRPVELATARNERIRA